MDVYRHSERGFNGAAPARGRKFIIKEQINGEVLMLQRGRPRAGAEMFKDNAERLDKTWLQRGRPRAGAEIEKLPGVTAEEDMLQRGRPRAGAEIILFWFQFLHVLLLQR